VVPQAGKTGNSVIVGSGARQFLRNRQDRVRLFLNAPREDKLRRRLARGKSENEAEHPYCDRRCSRGWQGLDFMPALDTSVAGRALAKEIIAPVPARD